MPLRPLNPFWQTTDESTVCLYHGDVIKVLQKLPARSVQCVITSPPYWGLRDYGTAEWDGGDSGCDHVQERGSTRGGPHSTITGGQDLTPHRGYYKNVCGKCGAKRIDQQIGSEATPDEFVAKMVDVFRWVRRVLRDDGCLWLNLGDSFSGGGGYSPDSPSNQNGSKQSTNRGSKEGVIRSLPSGNLVGIPWRVALALQADGWILRSDIVWSKKSPMPESVTNRCTKSHEYIFLLTKSMDYFYDAERIKEKSVDPIGSAKRYESSFIIDNTRTKQAKDGLIKTGVHASLQDDGQEPFRDFDGNRNKRDVWSIDDERALLTWIRENVLEGEEMIAEFISQQRNKSDVWRVSSKGYPGAHYATYPESLIEPCIRAGTSEKGACVVCGAPWKRVVEKKTTNPRLAVGYTQNCTKRNDGDRPGSYMDGETKTIGWEPTCHHRDKEVRPCIILDPFMGSGTTAAVGIVNGCWTWGIDLSEEYLRNNAIPRIEGVLSRPAWHHLIPKVRAAIVAQQGRTISQSKKEK